jgi:acyl-CoA reductase-like NAD-dependent aldehyde dehydrogenase
MARSEELIDAVMEEYGAPHSRAKGATLDAANNFLVAKGVTVGPMVPVGGLGHPKRLEEGNVVRPTIFVNVTIDMRIAQEEIFGPVISMLTYKTDEEAIQIANDTVYGLHAFVSSTNIERANRVARQIDAGRVLINLVGHDPLTPFGGFKQSGIGREYGIFASSNMWSRRLCWPSLQQARNTSGS